MWVGDLLDFVTAPRPFDAAFGVGFLGIPARQNDLVERFFEKPFHPETLAKAVFLGFSPGFDLVKILAL